MSKPLTKTEVAGLELAVSHGGDSCSVSIPLLARLLAEFRRLRAMEAKVDITADGVQVASGMKVYRRDPVGHIQGYDIGGHRASSDNSIPEPVYLCFELCYSTIEALYQAEGKR